MYNKDNLKALEGTFMDSEKVINHSIDQLKELEAEYQEMKKVNHLKKKQIQTSLSTKSARFNKNKDRRASHFDFIRNK